MIVCGSNKYGQLFIPFKNKDKNKRKKKEEKFMNPSEEGTGRVGKERNRIVII